MTEAVLFWGFGGLALLLGILVIVMPNPVHGAVALVGNLFCLAALFAMLQAHFVAAIQVLLYAGAILVLFLFVIMLLNLSKAELGPARQTAAKIAGTLLLGWFGVHMLGRMYGLGGGGFPRVGENFGTLEQVGKLVFGPMVLPFEVASVLLVAAILGAVVLAKRKIW
ncbi:MAG: NADH-quinone oxidoreductase subunit J [Deltaproteobacteria bacterium]|nr:MAG: NADH-quinone oxidoreductase subunit J [Deltaproteobacteria bacterium]